MRYDDFIRNHTIQSDKAYYICDYETNAKGVVLSNVKPTPVFLIGDSIYAIKKNGQQGRRLNTHNLNSETYVWVFETEKDCLTKYIQRLESEFQIKQEAFEREEDKFNQLINPLRKKESKL